MPESRSRYSFKPRRRAVSHDEGLLFLYEKILNGGFRVSKHPKKHPDVLKVQSAYIKQNYAARPRFCREIIVCGELDICGYTNDGYPVVIEVKERNGMGRAKEQLGKFGCIGLNPAYPFQDLHNHVSRLVETARKKTMMFLMFYFSVEEQKLIDITRNVPLFDMRWFYYLDERMKNMIKENYRTFRKTHRILMPYDCG